jgi:hypothetical protein
MPPRFPHRLTKPPTQMSQSELAVLAILGVSVTIGLYQMGSNMMQASGRRSSGGGSRDSTVSNDNANAKY